jgi:hypothetical protein
MTKRIIALAALALMAQPLISAPVIYPGADLVFPSIQEGASARAIAMGSTYVGVAEGSAALLWNPAGLGTMAAPEIAWHHNAGLAGSAQDIAVLGLPLGPWSGLGVAVNYQDDGTFVGRDSGGAVTGDYSARTYGAALGWGAGLPGDLYAGLALKANHQDLAGTNLDAVAGDLGLLWKPSPHFSLGAAYTNLGPDVQGRHLAQGLRVGLSSYLMRDEDFQWLLAVSGEAASYGGNSLNVGLEHTLYKFLALRAGYGLDPAYGANSGSDSIVGWTFGVGLILGSLSVDYAYVPLTDLGTMQRLSLTYAFGGHGQAGSGS